MHTLSSRIADEVDYFGEPDIDRAPRMWCTDCHRKTLYSRDMDGLPLCRECADETALDALEM